MTAPNVGRRVSPFAPWTCRAVDLVVLLLVGPAAAIVLLLLAVAVKLDSPGPAFISHRRLGKGGMPFALWKLRTMVADAEKRKAELAHLNVLPWPDFKIPNDPRVTRVGSWLRKTSLDELPQLWNVLRGEMTLVGPRPCSIPLTQYRLWQTERLEVTPGLVGRWQSNGRNSVDFETRCRMDITQIRRTSAVSALTMTVRTVRAVLGSRQQY
jgi:lipopolysaccharide/colanic/teichoic acid biosynthesis glycosyltransferase